MELRILNTFLKVAQLQSFSKAADSLGYSQSAITVQVQQLENELGVRLFDRIGKNVTITHYGQSFIPYARDVISSATKAAHFAVDDQELTGTLRIGSIESIITTSFSEILPEFHKRCPHVTTTIYSGGTQELLDMLHHNELDLIYTLDEPGYDSQLVKLFEQPEEVVVMAGEQHPLSKAAALSLHEKTENAVIVTLGKDGALAVDRRGRKAFAPGAEIDRVVDTIGAGDAHAGMMLFALAQGMDMERALTGYRRW